jgi:hypothetical protein
VFWALAAAFVIAWMICAVLDTEPTWPAAITITVIVWALLEYGRASAG